MPLITEHEIIIDEFAPETPGSNLITRVNTVKLGQFKDYVEEFLSTIPLPSAHDTATALSIAEWVSNDRKYGEDTQLLPWGKANYLVTCGSGSCEGTIIRILMLNQSTMESTFVVSIKYIHDEEDVWMIARMIETALQNGR